MSRPLPSSSRMRWPVLAGLQARLFAERRRRVVAAGVRGTVAALSLQVILLPLLAWASADHPYQIVWIRALQATFLLYLAAPAAVLAAWRRGQLGLRRAAEDLDGAGGPDRFRTLLSLDNHGPETLDALNAFYAQVGGEASLRAASPFGPFPWARLVLCLAAGALLPLASGHYAATVSRMLFPVATWNRRPVPRLQPIALPHRIGLGDTLRLRLRVTRLPADEPVYAVIRDARQEIRYPLERRGDTARLLPGPVSGDLTVRFEARGAETPEWTVYAVPPPQPDSFGAVIRSPAYTHLPPETLSQVPATQAVLPGSEVAWGMHTSEPLYRLIAVIQTAAAPPETLQLGAGSAFHFAREIRAPAALWLRLQAVQGGDTITGRAGPYRIELSADAPPEIALVEPDSDQALGRALKLPVLFRARDDYGLVRVRLCYAVFGDGLKSQGRKDITSWWRAASGLGGGVWDLGGLELYPGNVVEMHLEATDNDALDPHTARSQTVRLRLPSMEEVVTQLESNERNAATSVRSAEERAQALRREWDESGRPAPAPGPPLPGEWDVERVLSLEPRQSAQQVQSFLADAQPGKSARPGEARRAAQRAASALQRQVPAPGVSRLPLQDQKRILDTLLRAQENLTRAFSTLPPAPPKAPQAGLLQAQRAALQEQLHRQLQEQKDLRAWMQDQQRVAAERAQRLQQAEQDQARVQADMRQALEQMQKTMQKAAQNGVLTPEVMEKMQRVRELLQGLMPDSLMQNQPAATGKLDLDAVRKNLDDMLNHGDALRAGLDQALHMLEMLHGLRDLQNFSQTLRGLEAGQKDLQAKLSHGTNADSAAASQAALRRKLEQTLQSLDSLAARQAAFRPLQKQSQGRAAAGQMRAAEKQMRSGAKNAAAQSAAQAAQSLGQAAQQLDAFMQQFQGGPSADEIAAVVEETLELTRWIEVVRNPAFRKTAGWVEGDSALFQRVSETARWLRGKMDKLAARQPYAADELTAQASALGFFAQALAQDYSVDEVDSVQYHARLAARELLKWMDRAEHPPTGGSGGGMGLPQAGGSQPGGGLDALAGRLKGISGRQMAVNDATQQLLQAFMQGRQPGGGSAGGGESEGEGGEGNSQDGGGGKPGAAGGAAQAQQAVGESLEDLAESESDAGGAARKLRALAQEARDLENDLRSGRLSAQEIRQRQDRFQTRLLQAANALEVRGEDRRRQAEAYRGQALSPLPADSTPGRDWMRELRRRRDAARDLALSPEQRSYLEWYYDHLLAQ